MYSEEINSIVLDIGSSSIRAGYSGEDNPKFMYPSLALVDELEPQNNYQSMDIENNQNNDDNPNKNQSQNIKKKIQYGEQFLSKRRDNVKVQQIFHQGNFLDWDLTENMLENLFNEQLKLDSQEYPILMSEYSIHNSQQRQKLCQIMFEKLQVPNFFICKTAVLSSFASGRSSGLILDSGSSGSIAVPVHEGYALQKSIAKCDVGGDILNESIIKFIENKKKHQLKPAYNYSVSLDANMKKIVENQDFSLTDPSYEKYAKSEIARNIKETILKINTDSNENPFQETVDYELPDGNNISFSNERFEIADMLFNSNLRKDFPEKDLSNFRGLQTLVLDSINKCDIDIRKDFIGNIIACGGNTLIPGFSEKLEKSLLEIIPPNAKLKLIAYPSSNERRFSSWIGGSILSSLGSFQNLWISKKEYEENHSYIIEKKCP